MNKGKIIKSSDTLANALKLEGGFLSIKRATIPHADAFAEKGCTLAILGRAFAGETLYFSVENLTCHGAAANFGFADGLPNVPGGFGYFISHGRGEGFPPGEKVKASPEIGEEMLLGQPRDVMGGYNAICVKPYEPGDNADTVTALVTPDRLSALIHIFCFRKTGYDDVIAPMVSGCASIFRIPFGELKRERPRAVIGNIDVFSRPHFAPDTLFFTVSGKDFEQMLEDCENSVLASHIWKGVRARL
ncbi:MAG: DUF169 domain-containing protein [Oscillospiraceae bacterium]|nr:DUF169 domain-containing protein [Oscillospiraceae bacterium]